MTLTDNQKILLFVVTAYLVYRYLNTKEGYASSKVNCSMFATKKACPSTVGCFWNPLKQKCVKP